MMDHCEHVTRAHALSEGRLARRCVAYYRVSTVQQGQFGFSIEAQRAAVQDYIAANPGLVIAEFSEVMSEWKDSIRARVTTGTGFPELFLPRICGSLVVTARWKFSKYSAPVDR
jgi:hypothetical protein